MKKEKLINVRISDEGLDMIKTRANNWKVSCADYIRMCIALIALLEDDDEKTISIADVSNAAVLVGGSWKNW